MDGILNMMYIKLSVGLVTCTYIVLLYTSITHGVSILLRALCSKLALFIGYRVEKDIVHVGGR